MAHYVYYTANGQLYSSTHEDTDPVADDETLASQGMSRISGLPRLSETIAWDPATRTTITITPPIKPKYINSFDFIHLFTPEELHDWKNSPDKKAQHFFTALMISQTTNIDLNSSQIQNGLQHLFNLKIITNPNILEFIKKD